MQNYVFVIDQNKTPLNPVSPARARELLKKGKAAVFRLYPFTLILKHTVENSTLKPLTLKLDPGSRVSGIALLDGDKVIWAAELEHSGQRIKNALDTRSCRRRSRRNRKTRYRTPRFNNRRRQEGWLPPSLMHRVLTIETWVKRIGRYAPVTNIVMELVKFDTQRMQDASIEGVEYQQGELAGYELREYLLEKFGRSVGGGSFPRRTSFRKCAYCDKFGVPLQIEHLHPKSKGGSNRLSNLTLACEKCNQKKGSKPVEDFLKKDSIRLEKIKAIALQPLSNAAAMNATRWKLHETLEGIFPTTTGSGGQTKYNRIRLGLPKQHRFALGD